MQVVSFSIVCWVLNKYAYGPILDVLEARRSKIAESLDNADRIKKELSEAEATAKEIVSKAHAEATRIIEESRTAAKELAERETQRAVAQATDILTKAREGAQAEHDRMLAELRREVGRLVVNTTAKVTGKVLTEQDQHTLSEEAARELAA
jgi:F-type H+-transporting ATPase subunit b